MARISSEEARAPTARAETIYALASGAGRAAIAVLRVSGGAVRNIVEALAGKQPPPRHAMLTILRDLATGATIDQGLVLFFPAPNSFTGEDCAEFHIHGGPAVVAALIKALAKFPNTRPALAGELSRRAFENGKLDLTEIEGLADLIAAETEAQRQQAFRQMRGGLRHKAEAWRAALLEVSALVEAEIDFADEADVTPLAREKLRAVLAPIRKDLAAALAQARVGERIREGITVVIAGPPNAGKSTLFNALARREAAIVSPLPGTTRDAIEVHLDVEGYPFTVIDTAGQRETQDPIEQIGVRRARARTEAADLVLWLSELGEPPPEDLRDATKAWAVQTMIDLDSAIEPLDPEATRISAVTGAGLDRLAEKLAGFAREASGAGEAALITQERHRRAFEAAAAALAQAESDLFGPVELLAEDVRAAIRALEMLIGKVDVENILGEIFARFCIGK